MADNEPRRYGFTRDGREITDELIEELADEAERGYDFPELSRRRRPRVAPSLPNRLSVRVDRDIRRELDERAAREGRSTAEVVQRAIRRYLERG